jgi:hypothetical protein
MPLPREEKVKLGHYPEIGLRGIGLHRPDTSATLLLALASNGMTSRANPQRQYRVGDD